MNKESNREWRTASWTRYLESALRNQKALKLRLVRIRKIIKLRKENKKTLQEIGDEFHISRERVRQILDRFGINK